MKKVFIWFGTVIGAAAVMTLVLGALDRQESVRTISVKGECLTTAPRDKTAITLRIRTLAPTTVESMRAATNQASEITEYLTTLPVEMQTTQFDSYEKTEWDRNEQKSITLGIETIIAIEVSANNIETIEQVLETFAGVTNVYTENLRMYTSPETLKPIVEKCLGIAVENARVRADALAAGDGKKAGKMISVSSGTSTEDVVAPAAGNFMRSKVALTSSALDTSGTIVTKDTDVSVSVNAVFEIK